MPKKYAARLDIDYPGKMDRLTTFFRLFMAIPIVIVIGLLMGSTVGDSSSIKESNDMNFQIGSIGVAGGLFAATVLMILFRQVYPRWWFDFAVEINRFSTRVSAYVLLLTDKYPSTVEKQSVHLDFDYPNVKKDLNRWMPLFKWLLAVPHYIVLAFLAIGVLFATVVAWFAILFTGEYPKGLFDYVVGVERWGMRVAAYAFLLLTDEYPPFTLK